MSTRLPSDIDVGQIIDDRLGSFAEHYGIVVGLLDAGGQRIVSRGSFAIDNPRPLDADTLFELGSITKVFTALLLAVAIEHGEVALDDPVVKHLPAAAGLTTSPAQHITLRHLATHTSGLPREPDNLVSTNVDDPYAGYTVDMLYACWRTVALASEPGRTYAYSNLGAAMLARALMVRTGKSYAELIKERITDPLGMRNTWVVVPANMLAQLAPGHTQMLSSAPYRSRDAMIGNGGVFSSARDLLAFLAAATSVVETPLASAFATISARQTPIDNAGAFMGLGWHQWEGNGQQFIWHNGGTSGFRSVVVYERLAHRAVVVLSNVNTPGGVDDIGIHLIAGRPLRSVGSPEIAPTLPRAVDPARLDTYTGHYEVAPGKLMEVTRAGSQLSFQLPGKPKLSVHAQSDNVFRLPQTDITLTFEVDNRGSTVAVTMRGRGQVERLPRRQGPQ